MTPEALLQSLIGRTIIEVAVEEGELALGLDDGRLVWIYADEDGDMMMSISDEDSIPSQ
jgi:hypothetical protein